MKSQPCSIFQAALLVIVAVAQMTVAKTKYNLWFQRSPDTGLFIHGCEKTVLFIQRNSSFVCFWIKCLVLVDEMMTKLTVLTSYF